MYFNKRYQRVGSLFQGRYKAVLVDNELQFLYLTKYIHRNPLDISGYTPSNLRDYPYSSYRNYLGIINQTWVNTSKTSKHKYQEFVEEQKELSTEILTMGNITLDHDT